ncbi:MAG: polysaccharide deacetylase family protein [Xanthomarina sp.]
MTDVSNGFLVISLDFELHWGVFDKRSVSQYKENLENVKFVIPRLLKLAEEYNVKLTFATVGFLFAENKEELLKSNPNLLPNYSNPKFSPYRILNSIGSNEKDDEFHYGYSLINQIQHTNKHEIGTHTYSHYYCLEDGQTKEQFEADIIAAISIARKKNITITSIVFPRNQVNKTYLDVCKKHGIITYRGLEKHKIYNTLDRENHKKQTTRALRFIDAYFNLTGYSTYNLNEIKTDSGLVNLPSSMFLRPYSRTMKSLEPLKISRVKNAMAYAAKNKEIFHLWWHPHNFGSHINESFSGLEAIFEHYQTLNKQHKYESITMSELASYS